MVKFKYEIDRLADSNTETYRYRSVKPFIHFPNHQDFKNIEMDKAVTTLVEFFINVLKVLSYKQFILGWIVKYPKSNFIAQIMKVLLL